MTASPPDEPATRPAGDPVAAPPGAASPGRTYDQVLADAVRVLTEAARLTRPMARDENAGAENGPAWVDGGEREPADWAEFVTAALAGAAANIGGIEAALHGRSGSREAAGVRSLLASTVGEDEAYLLEHRTEPLVVDLYVDVILGDLGLRAAYERAAVEVAARYDAISPDLDVDEQDRQSEAIAELEELLERQLVEDRLSYGHALADAVRAAAEQLPGLRVPVTVHVDLKTFPEPTGPAYQAQLYGPAGRLREDAILATPLPGGGRSPLERLQP